MGSTQLTLNGISQSFPIPAPAGRALVTILSAPATVVATGDGSYPTLPSGATNNSAAVIIAGVIGESGIIQFPLFGSHMANPTINLASTGNPVVLIEW